ncbi:myb-related transcription factor, partner of profilin-like [Pleurodeles waltl]|uniref:myb-related transcription factor, partner of profilin-like n=1 Tax=Pleurodeles waltl TaxID=8319 RepID=UPI0037097DEE
MATQEKETSSGGRKRELKFSEKEVLTEECCLHHEELFGKAAMSVPDSHKKKICQDILNKMNANGVSHHTLDEVRKRWYDLRSRTKERVAERMSEMHGSGGGPSTVSPPTAIKTMVETTLEPEAVLGVGDLGSSAPGTSKDLPQGPLIIATVQGEDHGTDTQEEAATDTAGECRTTPPFQSAQEKMDDPALGGPPPYTIEELSQFEDPDAARIIEELKLTLSELMDKEPNAIPGGPPSWQEIAAWLRRTKLEAILAKYQRLVILEEEEDEAAEVAASTQGPSHAPAPLAQQPPPQCREATQHRIIPASPLGEHIPMLNGLVGSSLTNVNQKAEHQKTKQCENAANNFWSLACSAIHVG